VYSRTTEAFSFQNSGSFKHPRRVYNVVPGDFTHSGKLDLLVMSQSVTANQLELTLYPALVGGGFGTSSLVSLKNGLTHF
jgi:integrin alpha FG-GAP repeat containing protein 1